uniref:DHC_N1 domain-containing protein n=1 Tax=Macrostomum lignano TaxID=282301 RepID=A0A1I8GKM9_9PLAT
VILDDTMQPGSFLFVRTLIAKKLRLRSIMQLVKPRVFPSSDAKQARRNYQTGIQDNVDFQLDSSEGLLFVQLSLLREYTVTSIRLEAKVEALQKDVTGLRAAMHQMSSILHPQAETPQVSGFEVIDSWDDYIDFVEASEQRLSALRTHLRLFRRVKWQDSVRDMLDNILSLRMQAVVNFKGTDMRERALKAGVSTQLSIDDLGFKMAFLPYIQ